MTNRFKYILKKVDKNEVEITNKKFYTLKDISIFLNLDYQTTQKFYKLCESNNIKGVHSKIKFLYRNYRINDLNTIVDFD